MKVIAINGSPRKNWNTHILLEKALEGAKSKGAEVELFNLYDISYKGCISCMACKLKGKHLETCAVKDDLLPVLQKIHECDAVILGSPIYFGEVTGEMRSFIERLFFPYISYDQQPPHFGRTINAAFIYTMNVPEQYISQSGYDQKFAASDAQFKRIFGGNSEYLAVTETLQVSDYSKYAITMFDAAQRYERRETVFKDDCEKAFALGQRMCE